MGKITFKVKDLTNENIEATLKTLKTTKHSEPQELEINLDGLFPVQTSAFESKFCSQNILLNLKRLFSQEGLAGTFNFSSLTVVVISDAGYESISTNANRAAKIALVGGFVSTAMALSATVAGVPGEWLWGLVPGVLTTCVSVVCCVMPIDKSMSEVCSKFIEDVRKIIDEEHKFLFQYSLLESIFLPSELGVSVLHKRCESESMANAPRAIIRMLDSQCFTMEQKTVALNTLSSLQLRNLRAMQESEKSDAILREELLKKAAVSLRDASVSPLTAEIDASPVSLVLAPAAPTAVLVQRKENAGGRGSPELVAVDSPSVEGKVLKQD